MKALLSLLLVGLPELEGNLQRRAHRSLLTRIHHRFLIPTASLEDTAEYVRYRLDRAGTDRALFPSSSFVCQARATAPNQVWTWDITKLATLQKGVFLHAYPFEPTTWLVSSVLRPNSMRRKRWIEAPFASSKSGIAERFARVWRQRSICMRRGSMRGSSRRVFLRPTGAPVVAGGPAHAPDTQQRLMHACRKHTLDCHHAGAAPDRDGMAIARRAS